MCWGSCWQLCSDTYTKEAGNVSKFLYGAYFHTACPLHIGPPGTNYGISYDLNTHQIWSSDESGSYGMPSEYRNLSDCVQNTRVLLFVQICMHHLQCKDWLVFRISGKPLCLPIFTFLKTWTVNPKSSLCCKSGTECGYVIRCPAC